MQARERQITMNVYSDDRDVSAIVDAKQLTQVLTNLILNALAAAPEGGNVDLRLMRNAAGLSITVHDNGPGVEPDSREHLFEPFYTTREEGIGLGLAVSRELINGMGGTLEYRDQGAGATFVIRFPKGGED